MSKWRLIAAQSRCVAAKFTSLRMGPAPETDVEEEEVDNKMEEDGGEVIRDFI